MNFNFHNFFHFQLRCSAKCRKKWSHGVRLKNFADLQVFISSLLSRPVFLVLKSAATFCHKWSFEMLLNVEDSDGDDAVKHFSCQDHFFSRTTFVLRKSHHTDHGQFIKTIIMTIFKNKSVLKFIKSINWQKFGQYFLTYKIHPRYAS